MGLKIARGLVFAWCQVAASSGRNHTRRECERRCNCQSKLDFMFVPGVDIGALCRSKRAGYKLGGYSDFHDAPAEPVANLRTLREIVPVAPAPGYIASADLPFRRRRLSDLVWRN